MFEQTFVQTGKTNTLSTVIISTVAQLALIGIAVILPMWYFDVLPTAQLQSMLVAPPPQRIRVGGNVQQAMLVAQPHPIYPPLAKQARISGVVTLNAVIGKDGHIQNLTVAKGHPLLIQAALDAVKNWIYKPTLLNGE